MDWTIQEVASSAGVSSRTLRHYDAIGLLMPAGVARNGYRMYGHAELLRLQQILAFRELGMGLADIAAILDSGADPVVTLERLGQEFGESIERLQRQRASIQRALEAYRRGEQLMPAEIFEGFDHTLYKDEVEQNWGNDAYASSDAWWRSKSDAEKGQWQEASQELTAAWADAAARGVDPASDEAQALAARQNAWLAGIPGTPGAGSGHASSEYLLGLGDLYVADERFAVNYRGTAGAQFVAESLRVFIESRNRSAEG